MRSKAKIKGAHVDYSANPETPSPISKPNFLPSSTTQIRAPEEHLAAVGLYLWRVTDLEIIAHGNLARFFTKRTTMEVGKQVECWVQVSNVSSINISPKRSFTKLDRVVSRYGIALIVATTESDSLLRFFSFSSSSSSSKSNWFGAAAEGGLELDDGHSLWLSYQIRALKLLTLI